jgi:hypothetical protein
MIVVLGALVAGVFGSAAGLNLNGTTIQVGTDSSLVCDATGITVDSYQYNDNTAATQGVEGVTLKGVDAGCDGARLGFRLDDAAGNPLAFSKATHNAVQWWAIIDSTVSSYNFQTVGPDRSTPVSVDAEAIHSIHVWLEGNQD